MSQFEPRPFGKYYLTHRIAVGGMAEIYKAKTFGVDGFEKVLAIKKILSHLSADKDFISMLTDEAKLVVQLTHANIVQVYDLGRVIDDYFISMEFVDGLNLRDLIDRSISRSVKLPEAICLYIMSEVCKGLDYAHSKKDQMGQPLHIVHRDISPQNILVSYEGGIKITDFGIAKAAQNISSTQMGMLKGKVTYMAPEQAYGKPIDARSDLYSLGIVLYEILTAKRLFRGDSQIEVLKKIRTTKIDDHFLGKDVSKQVKPILAKMLAYRVNDRYQSAADIQVDLTRVMYQIDPEFTPRRLTEMIESLFATEMKRRGEPDMPVNKEQVTLVSKHDLHDTQTTDASGSVSNMTPDFIETLRPDEHIRAGQFDDMERTEKSEIHIWSWPPDWRVVAMVAGVALVAIVLFLIWRRPLPPPVVPEPLSPHVMEPDTALPAVESSQPAPPDLITLTINSVPPGATLVLDGTVIDQQTPATLADLRADQTYGLEISLKGYQSQTVSIVPRTLPEPGLSVSLQPQIIALLVDTTPPGATVTLNHQTLEQVTPTTISVDLSKTLPELFFELKGYTGQRELISPEQIESRHMSIALKPLPPTEADMLITSVPEKATLTIDGKRMGQLPLTAKLSIGDHTFKFESRGFQTVTKTVTVTAQPDQSYSIRLDPVANLLPADTHVQTKPVQPKQTADTKVVSNPAQQQDAKGLSQTVRLRVDSNPRGAQIVINGKKRGITPIVVYELPPGQSVDVQVSKKGYKTWQRRMTLVKESTELTADLQSDE